jgi:DNA polymerase-3 subunit delta
VAELRRAYLFHGDDHGRIAERRAGLRALGERESGPHGVEVLDGEDAAADAVAAALCAMTFALGRRFVIVDHVERWSPADAELVAPVIEGLGDDVTVAFFGREEGRAKVPPGLGAAVERAGGDVRAELTARPWELPKWAQARAAQLGLELPTGAARALVRHVGERQQRIARELEKLALALPDGAKVELEDVEELVATSAERRAWTLADALVAGDGEGATRAYLELRAQGERLAGLIYLIARRLHDARDVAVRLEAGEAPASIRKGLRMPTRAAERFMADVGRTDAEALGAAIGAVADLELASRGGADGVLAEDTRAIGLIAELTGAG